MMNKKLTISELEEKLTDADVLSKLKEPDLKKGLKKINQFYKSTFSFSFDPTLVTFSEDSLPSLIYALRNDIVDTYIIIAYPESGADLKLPLLNFWVKKLIKSGMGFYETESLLNNVSKYRFTLDGTPLWKHFTNFNFNALNWEENWNKIYKKLPSQPTVIKAKKINRTPQIIFTSSKSDIDKVKILNDKLKVLLLDPLSTNQNKKLTFANVIKNKTSILTPEEWLIFSSMPEMRSHKTSKLTHETWELFEAVAPTRAVGGNSNIEGLFMGIHSPIAALSYGRVRMGIR